MGSWTDPGREVLALGHRPGDDADLRAKKTVLTGMVLGGAVFSAFTACLTLAAGAPREAATRFVMSAVLFAALLAYRWTGRLEWLGYPTIATVLVVPAVAALEEGSLAETAALLGASALGPLIAALLWGFRAAGVTLLAYAAVVVAAVALLPVYPETPWKYGGIGLQVSTVVNLVIVGAVAAGSVAWLVRKRDEATLALAAAHERSESLLRNVLPEAIAERLKQRPSGIADHFDEATVLFADIVGFTPLARGLPPDEVVRLLDELFSRFDELVEARGLEKIKTIGDAYMVAGGVPSPRVDHAEAVARLALDMLDALRAHPALDLRIGIESGPVVAGVIGRRKFIYDLWGDTVNVASRMESHGVPGAVCVGEGAWARLHDRFDLEPRGVLAVKGLGDTRAWLLRRRS